MTQVRVKELSANYPVPDEAKLKTKLKHIERMAGYYRDMIPVTTETKSFIFKGYLSALIYCAGMMHMYVTLTKKLARLAEDDEK